MIGDSQIECPKMKQELMPMRQKLIPMKPPWFKKTSFILMLTLMVGANFISIFTIKLNSTHGEDNEHQNKLTSIVKKRKLGKQSIHPFKVWKGKFPCVTNRDSPSGIYYVRIPRTSAKPASVSKQIAKAKAKLAQAPNVCNVNDGKIPLAVASDQRIAQRDKSKSFLWSMVRHPARRAVSHYDMQLRLGEVKTTNEHFINTLKKSWSYLTNVQLRFLVENDDVHTVEDNVDELVSTVLSEFDFIGVQERMNESLVTLSMLLGLNLNDVIYEFSTFCLSSDDQPKWITTKMLNYLLSSEWMNKQKGDYELYHSANKALDLTIQQFDSKEFYSNLKEYEVLLDFWSDVSSEAYGSPGCGRMSLDKVDNKLWGKWWNEAEAVQKAVAYDQRRVL